MGLIPGDYGNNWGVMYNMAMESNISISFTPAVSENSKNVSENNSRGRVFEGMQVLISGAVSSTYPEEWGTTSGYLNGEASIGANRWPIQLNQSEPTVETLMVGGKEILLYPQTITSVGSLGSSNFLVPYKLLTENNSIEFNLNGGWYLGGNIPTYNMWQWMFRGKGTPFIPVEYNANPVFMKYDMKNWRKISESEY